MVTKCSGIIIRSQTLIDRGFNVFGIPSTTSIIIGMHFDESKLTLKDNNLKN